MDKIVQILESTHVVSKQTIALLRETFKPIKIKRRTLLIEPSTKNTNIYIVEQGIARAFNLIDGKEVTSWFSQEGDLIYSTNSFHGKTEGYEHETVQVLEDSLLYYMPIHTLEELCRSNIEIANWIRVVYQNAFLEMEQRLISQLYLSAEERYNGFVKNNQELFQRVNLGYIASYLGMSHVTLCALRK